MENTEKAELHAESVAKSLSRKLIDDLIVESTDITVSDQKLIIRNLLNFTGNYFADSNNECRIRCFENTPSLVAIICEYTLDTKISDVKYVENTLRDYLNNLGFIIIND